ncbi:MAG TPA: c-type cytochrome [Bacteroidales bacterium]|nr:c-type cytochrome [Bacteroidales bacterium]
MRRKDYLFFAVSALVLAGGLTAMKLIKDPWQVPANYKTMKNKVAVSKTSLAEGKELFDMACASCHGTTGKAKIAKGIDLFDLSSADFHAKFTDGEIYYQSFVGRNPWHNFTKAVPDETDRWNVVNYIRSLKGK